jgi:predicted transcriptional regulator
MSRRKWSAAISINVQEDIRILERHGLVRTAKEPRGKRKVKVPQVPFDEIALKIAI